MPVATWRARGYRDEAAFGEHLRTMYEDEALSQAMVADRLGIHPETVASLFKRHGIVSRTRSAAFHIRHQRDKRTMVLSGAECAVLDGLLLGDGHIAKTDGDCSARYTHGSKHRETLDSIQRALPSLRFSPARLYASSWFFKTLSYLQLVAWRTRWYPEGQKRVPADLALTPATCYWWFIGDGSISKTRHDLKLSTDGFSDICRQRLRHLLAELRLESNATAAGSLLIKASDVPRFYEHIGPCKNSEYAYNWE